MHRVMTVFRTVGASIAITRWALQPQHRWPPT